MPGPQARMRQNGRMTLEHRIRQVQDRVSKACESVHRDPASVCLVAVTKSLPVDVVREAYDLGLRLFGESRAQELVPKSKALPQDIVWHFIGRLQSNKAKKVASIVSAIHTIEKESQLVEIEKGARTVDILVEVNVAGEQQKAGILPEELDKTVVLVEQYKCVRFRGLMTIGPLNPDPEESRPVFRSLAELGREVGAEWLSMGMSADFEVAVQEGSTHVRVGTAVFGERQ